MSWCRTSVVFFERMPARSVVRLLEISSVVQRHLRYQIPKSSNPGPKRIKTQKKIKRMGRFLNIDGLSVEIVCSCCSVTVFSCLDLYVMFYQGDVMRPDRRQRTLDLQKELNIREIARILSTARGSYVLAYLQWLQSHQWKIRQPRHHDLDRETS